MLGAGWVMWLLVLLSIVGLMIILERAYYLFASRDDIQALKNDLLGLLRKKDVDGAKKRLAESRSLEARIVSAGLEAHDDGAASAEERMGSATLLARLHMERNLAFL
ncbi:MAG: MotA/TolQ/ExbB proton channel family protein, partial [Myxococcales bacterium]|nr:MotA/TolQ/ExbB proton channel family protein [Myxococcales bacterium]